MDAFLAGKTALVTGGGRGIGKAIAMRLASAGARVAVAARSVGQIEATAAAIRERGGKALAIRADLADEGEILAMFKAAAELGPLDILVNNAGIGCFGRLVDATMADWERTMAINLRAPFICCREAMKAMAGRGGRIVNIGSVVGYKGYVEQGIYTASKHGLMGLTKVIAVEGQKDGIIAQIICPGGVATDMLGEARPDLVGGDVMSPEDVADAVEYLLRQRGNAVTDMIALRRRNGTPW